MEHIKWTERKFMFGYDTGYIPLFIERLQCTAPRLEELLRQTDEAGAGKRQGDDWSVKEHIGHLCDLELLHDGRIDDFIEGKQVLRAADMNNKATYDADHNHMPTVQLMAEFRKARKEFIDRIAGLDTAVLERKAMHPRLQQLINIADLLYFVGEHDTHHLMRVAEIVSWKPA